MHVCHHKQGSRGAGESTASHPSVPLPDHGRPPPEAGDAVGIDRVVDVHTHHLIGAVRPDHSDRHLLRRCQVHLQLGCLRKCPRIPQHAVEEPRPCKRRLRQMPVIEVWRNAQMRLAAGDHLPVGIELIEHAMEVVVRPEVENRTADLLERGQLVDRRHVER